MNPGDAGPPARFAPSGEAHPLARLKRHTDARIALGRAGAGLPTAAHLDFAEAHAKARDAVHAEFDADRIASELETAGFGSVRVTSRAGDRVDYLKRPDLGRRLSVKSKTVLEDARGGAPSPAVGENGCFDLALIVADGLSARAVNAYAVEVAILIAEHLAGGWRIAPVVIACGARVALSDPIGETLGARIALILIGERPGLTAADSLGAYLTFEPKPGRSDAQRNCVSNIRKGGLRPREAARKLAGLLRRSRELQLSGTKLKDDVEHRLDDPTHRRVTGD